MAAVRRKVWVKSLLAVFAAMTAHALAAEVGAHLTCRLAFDGEAPLDVAAAGWSVNGGTDWHADGDTVNLTGGKTYEVCFRSPSAGWLAPTSFKLSVPDPVRYFDEWCEACSTYKTVKIVSPPEEWAFVARFVPDRAGQTVSVTFDAAGGKVFPPQLNFRTDAGAVYADLPRPLPRAGLVFGGWMTSGGEEIAEGDAVRPGLTALRAKWEKTYSLTLQAGASGSYDDKYGKDAGASSLKRPAGSRTAIQAPKTSADGKKVFSHWQVTSGPSDLGPDFNALSAQTVVAMPAANLTLKPVYVEGTAVGPEAERPSYDATETLRNVVDVIIGYDTGAQDWLRERGIDPGTFAAQQIAKANETLANSCLDEIFSFRLVRAENVGVAVRDYGAENARSFNRAVMEMQAVYDDAGGGDSPWAAFAQARNDSGADLQMLVAYTGDTEGTIGLSNGYDGGWSSPARYADYAVGVCEITAAFSTYCLVHELGHLMGAGHASADQVNPKKISVGPQLYDDSCAYVFQYGESWYSTVMGYWYDGYGKTLTWIPYFSSPDVTFKLDGVDTGVPTGVAGKYDNAATLLATYEQVACFRRHRVPHPGLVESKVSIAVAGNGSASGAGVYEPGMTVRLQAAPAGGSVFAGWYDVTGGETNRLSASGDWRETEQAFVAGSNDVDLVARFLVRDPKVDVVTDIRSVLPEGALRAGVETDVAPVVMAESGSLATFKASGLPSGLKYDAAGNRFYGTPSKPGVYKVSFTATNLSKSKLTKKVSIVVGNWRDAVIPVKDAYGPFVPGVPVTLDFSGVADGCSVSGLPSGMKWTKATATVTGAPSKPGTNTVVFTKSVRDPSTGKRVTHKASSTFVTGAYPRLSVVCFGNGTGKVSGAGAFAANKKVTLRATADTRNAAATSKKAATVKSAFAGWYLQADDPEPFSQAASLPLSMPAEDTVVYARFVTSAEDAGSIAAAVNGFALEPWVSKTETHALSTNVTAGVYLQWPVAVSALSATTVKVSGLPSGLKFTAKDILKKGSKTEVEIPAMTIYGAPTAASKVDKKTGKVKPSQVKVTVTTAGKSKQTYQIDLTVDALPAWAVGTFNGWSEFGGEGSGTLTVSAAGKLSGKTTVQDGKKKVTTSYSAAYFTAFGDGVLTAELTFKSGKETRTETVCLSAYDCGGMTLGQVVEADESQPIALELVQNPWMRKDKEVTPPAFPKKALVCELTTGDFAGVTLTVKAKGAVTASGKLTDGTRFSASAQLLLVEGDGTEACVILNGRKVELALTVADGVITAVAPR